MTQPDGLPLALAAEGKIEVVITARVQIMPETQTSAPETNGTIKLVKSIPFPFPQETSYEYKSLNISVPNDGLAVFSFDAPTNATFLDIKVSWSNWCL